MCFSVVRVLWRVSYEYLPQVDNVNDKDDYGDLIEAFRSMGIAHTDRKALCGIILGILHLVRDIPPPTHPPTIPILHPQPPPLSRHLAGYIPGAHVSHWHRHAGADRLRVGGLAEL